MFCQHFLEFYYHLVVEFMFFSKFPGQIQRIIFLKNHNSLFFRLIHIYIHIQYRYFQVRFYCSFLIRCEFLFCLTLVSSLWDFLLLLVCLSLKRIAVLSYQRLCFFLWVLLDFSCRVLFVLIVGSLHLNKLVLLIVLSLALQINRLIIFHWYTVYRHFLWHFPFGVLNFKYILHQILDRSCIFPFSKNFVLWILIYFKIIDFFRIVKWLFSILKIVARFFFA